MGLYSVAPSIESVPIAVDYIFPCYCKGNTLCFPLTANLAVSEGQKKNKRRLVGNRATVGAHRERSGYPTKWINYVEARLFIMVPVQVYIKVGSTSHIRFLDSFWNPRRERASRGQYESHASHSDAIELQCICLCDCRSIATLTLGSCSDSEYSNFEMLSSTICPSNNSTRLVCHANIPSVFPQG